MKTRLRRALLIFAVLVGVVVLSILILDLNMLRGPIERMASERIGRPVSIAGDMDLHWRWPPEVTVQGVSVGNTSWGAASELFAVDQARVAFFLWPLFVGRVVFPEVELSRPRVMLERQGARRNWVIKDDREDDDAPTVAPRVDRLIVTDGRVEYLDRGEKTEISAAVDLTREPSDPALPLEVSAQGIYRGERFTLKGSGGPVLSIHDVRESYPLKVDATVGASKAHLAGHVRGLAAMDALDVQLRLQGASLGHLQRILPLALPQTPPYQIAGQLTRTGNEWTYQKFSGRMGDSDLSGSVRFIPGKPRPRFEATLTSQQLDFDDLAPLIGAPPKTGAGETASAEQKRLAAKKQASERVLPDRPLGTDAWDRMDAKVAFQGKRVLKAAHLPLDDLKFNLDLQDRVLKLTPLEFGAAGGRIISNITIDGREKPPRVAMEARVARLKLNKLFPTLETMKTSVGEFYGNIRLKGRGASIADIFSHANGEFHVALAEGQISNLMMEVVGIDGGEIIKFLLAGDRNVRLRCAVANFGVIDGIAESRALVVDTEDTNVVGTGRIDFTNERLDLRFYPAPKDPSILVLRSPLYITGTFKNPQARPDVTAMSMRGIGAILLGLINPLLAVAPLIETGPGKDSNCAELLTAARGWNEKAMRAEGTEQKKQTRRHGAKTEQTTRRAKGGDAS